MRRVRIRSLGVGVMTAHYEMHTHKQRSQSPIVQVRNAESEQVILWLDMDSFEDLKDAQVLGRFLADMLTRIRMWS